MDNLQSYWKIDEIGLVRQMRVHYISGHGRFVKQYSLTCPSSLRSQVAVTRTVYIIDQR